MNINFKGLSAAFITIFSSLDYMSAPKKSCLGRYQSPFSRLKLQTGNALLKKLSHHSLDKGWSTKRSSLFCFDERTGSALFAVASKRSLGYVQIFPTFGIPNFSFTLRHTLAQIPYQWSITTSPHGLNARLIFFNTSKRLKNINLHQYHITEKKDEKIIPDLSNKKSSSIQEASRQSKETLLSVKTLDDLEKREQDCREKFEFHHSLREKSQNKKTVSKPSWYFSKFFSENSTDKFSAFSTTNVAARKSSLDQERGRKALEGTKELYHVAKNDLEKSKEVAVRVISDLEETLEGLESLRDRKTFVEEKKDLEEWKMVQDFFDRQINKLNEAKNQLKNVLKKAENIKVIDAMELLNPEIERCEQRWYHGKDPENKNEFEEMYNRWINLLTKENQVIEWLEKGTSKSRKSALDDQKERREILDAMQSSP